MTDPLTILRKVRHLSYPLLLIVLCSVPLNWLEVCLADEPAVEKPLAGESADNAAEPSPGWSFEQTRATLDQACGDCHGYGAAEGGFELGQIESVDSLSGDFERWQKVRTRINDRSMPPADSEPLADDDREALVNWIEQASVEAICQRGEAAGPPIVRRLAKHEYSNTIRDLLGIHFDAGQGLPEDAAGGEGFNNAAETLTISPIHAEKYLQAATDALEYASKDASARKKLLPVRPELPKAEETLGAETSADSASIDRAQRAGQAARENLTRFMRRAFRRPVDEAEVEVYVRLFESAYRDGLPFEQAVFYAMRGVLISPNFLFISEASPRQIGETVPVSDHELANRLSYFLWATMPDQKLRQAADEGTLNTEEQLRKQTLRMLSARGTHLQDSMAQFMGSWLSTADVGHAKKVDRERHPRVDDPDVAALRNQPIYAMEHILRENQSLLELIDADWSFVNNELVRLYRLDRDKIEGKFVQKLVHVKLPEEYRYRGGLLGMGGVYVVSSYPGRSSPVLRGAWVLEKMLGVELPPPPPNVPPLEETESGQQVLTVRQRLERHRADPACATCHNRIDPIGFAMENFDEIGRWRETDGEAPIDSLASLPGGVQIAGIQGLKQHLLQQKGTFIRVLTRKMLGYALGRALRPNDLCTVEMIVKRLEQKDYAAQELILGIVTSEPFRKKMVTEENKL